MVNIMVLLILIIHQLSKELITKRYYQNGLGWVQDKELKIIVTNNYGVVQMIMIVCF